MGQKRPESSRIKQDYDLKNKWGNINESWKNDKHQH
jgi:hypothetical protein